MNLSNHTATYTGLAILSLGFATTNTTQAALAVSNLGETVVGSLSFGSDSALLGVSFTTGDIATQMSSLEFLVGPNAGYQSSTVALYTSSSAKPGSSLTSWTYPNVTTGQTVTVNTTNFNLSASTEYFLVFSSTHAGGPPNISATNSPDETVGDAAQVGTGWTIGNIHYVSTDTGQSWTPVDSSAGQIQINVVPEPSSLALLGLGSFALILRRRK